jgi:biotin transport system substrate-specific component
MTQTIRDSSWAPSVAAAPLVPALAVRSPSPRLAFSVQVAGILFFSVLTAAASQVSVPLPFTPVPFTLQPVVVLLAGASLGARAGLASQLLYLAAGLAGAPVFAASPWLPPGVARLLGPTGGYLLGYPLAAWLTGLLAERGYDRRYLRSVLAMAAGLAVIFTWGVAWLAFAATPFKQAVGLPLALRTGLYPFLPLDLLKVLAASAILPGIWRLVGRELTSNE